MISLLPITLHFYTPMTHYLDQLSACGDFDDALKLNIAYLNGEVSGTYMGYCAGYECLDLNPQLLKLLVDINEAGMLTTNSQPGVYIDDPKPLMKGLTHGALGRERPLPQPLKNFTLTERGRMYIDGYMHHAKAKRLVVELFHNSHIDFHVSTSDGVVISNWLVTKQPLTKYTLRSTVQSEKVEVYETTNGWLECNFDDSCLYEMEEYNPDLHIELSGGEYVNVRLSARSWDSVDKFAEEIGRLTTIIKDTPSD